MLDRSTLGHACTSAKNLAIGEAYIEKLGAELRNK
jgi:hypothetical protein